VRTTDVTGAIRLPEGVEMVMPGDNIEMTVELIQPVAMEEGVTFAIRGWAHRWGWHLHQGRKLSFAIVGAQSMIAAPTHRR